MATQFPAPPVRTPFPDKQWTTAGGRVNEAGYPSWGWMKWFQEIAAAFNTGTGTGLVTSVFGRSGAVVAVNGDYNVNQVTGAAPTNSPAFTGVPTAPTAGLGTNTTQIATTAFVLANAPASPVSSVFGRTGAVVAQSGDYSFSQISGLIAPSQVISGSVNLTAQTANVAATTLFAVGGSGAGLYLVTVYLVVSTPASVSSTLPDSRIIFTDQDSAAAITVALTSGLTTNTTSTFAQGTLVINAKASTNIQYDIGQVTAYASDGTAMQFAYRARVEYLG